MKNDIKYIIREKEKEVVQAEQIKDDAPQRDQDILKIKYILNK